MSRGSHPGPRDTLVREVIPEKARPTSSGGAHRRNEVKLEEQAAQKVIEFADEANEVHRIGVIDIRPFISILRLIAMATKTIARPPGMFKG